MRFSVKTRLIRSTLLLLGIAVVIVALDQYTKYLVRRDLPLNTSASLIPWLDGVFTFTHVQNTGAAFGLLPQFGGMFILVALIVIVVIVLYMRQLAEGSWLLRIAFGLQLGGATGNLIDRLARGHVTDFIHSRWWPAFPVFNIADSAITVGTILLVIYALFLERGHEPKDQLAPHKTEPSPSHSDQN